MPALQQLNSLTPQCEEEKAVKKGKTGIYISIAACSLHSIPTFSGIGVTAISGAARRNRSIRPHTHTHMREHESVSCIYHRDTCKTDRQPEVPPDTRTLHKYSQFEPQ